MSDIPSGRTTDPEIALTELRLDLKKVLNCLTERERGVIDLRYGLSDGVPRTFKEIAIYYGVTKERISKIESQTMEKLNQPIIRKLLERDYSDLPAIQRF